MYSPRLLAGGVTIINTIRLITKLSQIFSLFLFIFFSLTDAGGIYARLLDHKPIVQGELKCFVKEFEVCVLNM